MERDTGVEEPFPDTESLAETAERSCNFCVAELTPTARFVLLRS